MKEIYNQLIENTKKISAEQGNFILPTIENAKISIEDFDAIESIVDKRKYFIENDMGKIEILSLIIDRYKVEQIIPDLNIVEITYKNVNGIEDCYTFCWSDKMYKNFT